MANQFPLHGARGLGSTSYVTDADGNIAQHVEYIPYGEVFVEERNNSFSTNYLFNAKELDNETGLYYYGARYLDPTGAMWLSVDPMWEKYAGMSPYNYCMGNPVKMVDPDGKDITEGEELASNIEKQVKAKMTERIESRNAKIRQLNQLNQKKRTNDKIESQKLNLQNGINKDQAYIDEYNAMLTDIDDMRKSNKKFRLKLIGSGRKDNNVSFLSSDQTEFDIMFTNDIGDMVHECRHGGDIARGTLTKDSYKKDKSSFELSAYRAQIAILGSFEYLSWSKYEKLDVQYKNKTDAVKALCLKIQSNPFNLTKDFLYDLMEQKIDNFTGIQTNIWAPVYR